MKFRELLEKYINNPNAKKEWEYMIDGYLPITPSLMKKIETESTAYHVTNVEGLKNLLKIQGKKKTISAFTKGSEGLATGAYTRTAVLIKLRGKEIFHSERDLWSAVDRNGNKWIRSETGKELIINNKFKVPIQKAIIQQYNLDDRFSIPTFVQNLTGTEKRDFIKFYYDEAAKILTVKLLKDIIADIDKTYQDRNFSNDEVLMHSFKIQDIKIIEDDEMEGGFTVTQNIKYDLDQLKIKYSGTISKQDLAKIK